MLAIFKKELRSYFLNAIGYVYLAIFLSVSALLCCYTTLGSGTYDTTTYFSIISIVFIVLIPLLTMRLFAEEKKLRTEQLLLTSPVSIAGMIFGKFLAAFTLFASAIIVSLVNFIPLSIYARIDGITEPYNSAVGNVNVGPVEAMIFSNTLGLLFLGAAFIAVGMFISSLTENQLAAAIITVSIIAAMLLLNVVNSYIDNYAIRFIISWVCFMSRFAPFQSGIFDPSSLLYFVSVTGVFLFLTARVYDKRRWG